MPSVPRDSLSCNLSECYTLVVQYMLLFVCLFVSVYLFGESANGAGAEREGERESQAGSILSAEPNSGLSHDPGIVT